MNVLLNIKISGRLTSGTILLIDTEKLAALHRPPLCDIDLSKLAKDMEQNEDGYKYDIYSVFLDNFMNFGFLMPVIVPYPAIVDKIQHLSTKQFHEQEKNRW